ncbi:ketopantoate reductase family protein [Nitratiruptor tergarcus]|uniref:2-dehydropantoate 2-reductase n=1 Tax=Nitratiruptor tergarcus DSM 16512 TaxID=1069081 RepID=A0A1W1WTZ7_9BACT|nr:2-dehydropantoate 2-reductase [Nitratiruptor tergarcus]SMC09213.1 ketopantoate reductase [Nitratiruptor tergarcus DSM 16512]
MKIAVVGGGGVGGYIAAKLSEHFHVDLLSKSMQQLHLIENGKLQTYHPHILDKPKGVYDIIFFATKSTVLPQRAKELQTHIHTHTIIVPLLNGIEPYNQLKKLFPTAKVLKGAIYIIANKVAPDTIELKGKGALVVTEQNETLAHILQTAEIKYKMPQDIDKAIWQKYLFIAATAALTTLYNATFGEIAKNHLDEFTRLLKEIKDIANKEGIPLNEEDIERSIMLLEKSPPNAKTSMQLDFEKGAPSEVDNLIGYLAQKSPLFTQIHNRLLEQRR